MLSLGVIEESNSAWSSPVTLVSKPNGKVRLCLDARKLNEVTVKDAYPLPIIEGLLGRLDQTKFISSLDLKDAFWQIPLTPESRDKTAFTVYGRPLYQFTVMPFGLCNAPQTKCRLMHRVVPHELHDRIFVYLDDLLATSGTFDEHIQLLSTLANLLKKAGSTINVDKVNFFSDKSKFLLKNLKYFGYIVGEGSLKVDQDKVKAITEFVAPNTIRKVRKFLGMAGWYRRFIADYATIAAPLSDLLKKNKKFCWTTKAQYAFDHLKQALVNAPVLIHPNFTKLFIIQCDASTTGVGGVLCQQGNDGEEHPIAYMSQKLNTAQRNYSVTELECFAAVLCVKKFRAYIEGYNFKIVTDHASLKWLMQQKDLTGRLARWSLKLQSFNFTIEHRSGAQNIVPDALSRAFVEEITGKADQFIVSHVKFSQNEFKTEEYLNLIARIEKDSAKFQNLRIINDKVYIKIPNNKNNEECITDIPTWKLFVPSHLVIGLIKEAHDPPTSAHAGIFKTLNLLQRFYYWPNMANDVREYIINCDKCKTTKALNYVSQPMMGKQTICLRAMQRLYVDFLDPYPRSVKGHTYLLVVLDHYTKYIFVKPMRKAVASEVCTFLEKEIFMVYSVPESIVSDNGPQFQSKCLTNLCSKYGVKHMLTPKYTPQVNASERVNRSILAAIRAFIQDDYRTWDCYLPEIVSALRNTIHISTQFSPHYLMYGQHLISHGDSYKLLQDLSLVDARDIALTKVDRLSMCHQIVLGHLKEAYERNASQYNLRSRQRVILPGQVVFVKNFVQSNAAEKFSAKLAPKFVEARVGDKVGNVAYNIHRMDGTKMGIYHMKDIRT